MLPSFEIYLSVLTDDLMPWLEENNRDEKYEVPPYYPLVGKTEGFPSFFKQLETWQNEQYPLFAAQVQEEIKQLSALTLLPDELKPVEPFLQLPCTGLKTKFYNMLTGYSLAGYWCMIRRLIDREKGKQLAAYHLSDINHRILSLLKLPAPEKGLQKSDRLIFYRVKAALAVLYDKTKLRYPGDSHGVLFLSAKDIILEQLESLETEPSVRDNLCTLMDNLTAPVPDKPQAMPLNKTTPENAGEVPRSDDDLFQMARGLETEMGEFKEVITQLAEAKNKPTGKTSVRIKMLGSGDVCRILNISKSTLKRYRDTGKIPFKKLGGKFLYSEEAISELLGEG